jgi:hypothetical protein
VFGTRHESLRKYFNVCPFKLSQHPALFLRRRNPIGVPRVTKVERLVEHMAEHAADSLTIGSAWV